MTDYSHLAAQLASFIETKVPALQHQQIAVAAYDGQELSLKAPLQTHLNDKGTAFGGSLYGISVLCGWGMVFLKCKEQGLQGNIVVAKGEIDYLRPSKAALLATVSAPSSEALSRFVASFRAKGKAALNLQGHILNENGQPAVHFQARYALIAE